ncbi:redoxin domain-containing protein, partial [Citrobacter freundii]
HGACVEQDDKGWDARKRAYCLKIQPATGSFARNLIYSTKPYSVSTDTHFTHKAWHSSSETIAKIKYAMIGDPTGALTRNFDNMREDEGLADRATFVVDPQGIIQAIEVTAEGIGRDASDLLRKIKAAQYVASHPGEVCPAKWKEGEATLAPSLDLVGKI